MFYLQQSITLTAYLQRSYLLHNLDAFVSSDYVWGELEKILAKRYPSLKGKLDIIKAVDFKKAPKFDGDFLDLKKKDIPIVRAAQYFSCDYLVTGDVRDFKPLMNPTFGVLTKVVTPKKFSQLFSL